MPSPFPDRGMGLSLSMTDLNTDCLRRIFLYVPVADRIKLRRVFKRFRDISDDCLQSVKKLTAMGHRMVAVPGPAYGVENLRTEEEVSEIEKGLSGVYNFILIKTTNRRLIEGLMKRCGEFLTTLDGFYLDETDSVLSFAAEHCRKLENLMMSVSSKADDKQMHQLMAGNSKLKTLVLEISFKNVKLCFRTIPTEFLEGLRINVCDMRPPPLILMAQKEVVRKARFLRKLDFNTLDDELVELTGKKSQLESLKLETVHAYYLTKTGLNSISHLRNLRELSIRFPDLCKPVCFHKPDRAPLSDDFFATLTESLQLLKKLNFQAPTGVTDKGFAKLASLPKLRHLTMEHCEEITDKCLILFDKIEILGFIECEVHDEGVIKFLEKSRTIRHLNLGDTHITNKSLEAAVQATKKRENGLRLILFVADTKTTPEELSDTSPLLQIVK